MLRIERQVLKEGMQVLKENMQVVKENGQVVKEARVSWEAFHGQHLAPHSFSFFYWYLIIV